MKLARTAGHFISVCRRDTVDAYSGYDAALSLDGRSTAYCLAHARRKFDELVKANASVVAGQAIQRIAWLYRIEADAKALTAEQRLQMRQERSQCVFRSIVTARFGIVTAEFGHVTDRFGDVSDRVLKAA